MTKMRDPAAPSGSSLAGDNRGKHIPITTLSSMFPRCPQIEDIKHSFLPKLSVDGRQGLINMSAAIGYEFETLSTKTVMSVNAKVQSTWWLYMDLILRRRFPGPTVTFP